MTNHFTPLSNNDLQTIDGGGFWLDLARAISRSWAGPIYMPLWRF